MDNIFNRIAIMYLKKNKIRTVATIIGITLAVTLITMISTIVVSGQNFLVNMIGGMDGTWHLNTTVHTLAEAEKMVSYEEVQQYGLKQDIGFSEIKNTVDESRKYVYISGISDEYFDLMPIELLYGRLPTNSSEIILPEHFLSDTGNQYNIGDKVIFNVGRRIHKDGDDLGINYGYSDGETIKEVISKEYTIVGVMKQLSTEGGQSPLWYETCSGIDANILEDTEYRCYLKLNKPTDLYNFIDKYIKNKGFGWNDNSDYLGVIGAGKVTAQQLSLYGVGVIIIFLIVIASVCLINNAFAISINERIKQFGILSSVGGTSKQLSKMIYFEAFVVCIIGIPLGIIIGVLTINILVKLCGEWISGLFLLKEPLELKISGVTIIIASLISFFTVLLSAAIPAKSIKLISPMDAISNRVEQKIVNKKIKTSNIIYRLLGLEGMLALKEYKKNKKRYKSVIISLTVSVLLFVVISTVGLYVKVIARNYYPSTNSDIYVYSDNLKDIEEKTSLYTILREDSMVKDQRYHISYGIEMLLEENQLSPGVYQNLAYEQQLTSDNKFYTIAGLKFIPDIDFNKYVESMSLTTDRFYDNEKPMAVLYDTVNYTKYNPMRTAKGSFLNHNMKEIELNSYIFKNDIYEIDKLGEFNQKPLTIEIAAFSNELPMSCDTGIKGYGSNISIIMPESMRDIITRNYTITPTVVIGYKVENPKKAFIKMEEIIKENYKDVVIINYAEKYEISKGMVILINFTSYLFVVIFMSISIANILNTMITNIGLRKRELAILQSSGMSDRSLNKMMNIECLIYALKSVLYGTILALLINIIIYLFLGQLFDIGFLVPFKSYLISIICVFISIFGVKKLAIRKISNENIVERIRSENI